MYNGVKNLCFPKLLISTSATSCFHDGWKLTAKSQSKGTVHKTIQQRLSVTCKYLSFKNGFTLGNKRIFHSKDINVDQAASLFHAASLSSLQR